MHHLFGFSRDLPEAQQHKRQSFGGRKLGLEMHFDRFAPHGQRCCNARQTDDEIALFDAGDVKGLTEATQTG